MHLEVLRGEARSIFPHLKIFKNFALGGGTGLALQIGHRVSIDFDLFNTAPIKKNLLQRAEKEFYGEKIKIRVNTKDELTLFINDTKTTFLRYPFPFIDPFKTIKGVAVLGIREICAMKAYALGRRAVYKDYVDLYMSLKEGRQKLRDIIRLAEKKYGGIFDTRLFLEQLLYLEDIEDTEIQFLKKKTSKKEILDFFQKKIKAISI